jgi:hypothetical protein
MLTGHEELDQRCTDESAAPVTNVVARESVAM